jgi:hypothetical protein
MIFDRIYLIQALVLLLFPLGLFFGKGVSLRHYSSAAVADDFSLARSWAMIPALWIDPLRAFLGTLLLNDENFAVSLPTRPTGTMEHQKLFLTVGVLALALLVQMFAVRNPDDDDTLLTPVGFTIGMIFALISMPTVAVLSTVVAIASVAAFRSWHAFFLGAVVAVVGTGFLLMHGPGDKDTLGAVVLLLVEPVVVCVVARREFVIPVRRRPD